MREELWTAIRNKHGVITASPLYDSDEDLSEPIAEEFGLPNGRLESVSGFTCVIAYRNAKGEGSRRQVTCIRLEEAAETLYLRAYCHSKTQNRRFRLDRVEAVADVHTGEIVADDAVEYFARFKVGHRQTTKLGWGLSFKRKADLLAGMNALVFMARCDREYHPAEHDEIERFVCSYWLREELSGEPPIDDILAHAKRLSPDPEVFFASLMRCHDRPSIAPIIRRSIQSVVEADGRVHDKEFYWGNAVDDYFRALAI